MTDKIAFGQFILRKRKELALTQSELAARLYVTESAVSKWERGQSYPDITLVRPLCEALGVSEHEFITASDDNQQHRIERQAATLRKLERGWLAVWTVLYGATIVACLIGNLVSDHALTWFWVVLCSLGLAFSLTNLPLLVKRHKGGATLGAAFCSLSLLMLASNLLTGGGFWWPAAFVGVLFGCCVVFLPLLLRGVALPEPWTHQKTLLCMLVDTVLCALLIATALAVQGLFLRDWSAAALIFFYCLPAAWLCLLIWRYLKLNTMMRLGLTLFLGALYGFLSNNVIGALVGQAAFRFPSLASSGLGNAVIIVGLLIVGVIALGAGAFLLARRH